MRFISHAFLLFSCLFFADKVLAEGNMIDTFSQEELASFRKTLQERTDLLESNYQKEQDACHETFLVNRCLSESKSRYIKEKQVLRAEEVRANERDRQLRKDALAQKEVAKEEALKAKSDKEAEDIARFREKEAKKQQARAAKQQERAKKAIEGRKDAEERRKKREAIEKRSVNQP